MDIITVRAAAFARADLYQSEASQELCQHRSEPQGRSDHLCKIPTLLPMDNTWCCVHSLDYHPGQDPHERGVGRGSKNPPQNRGSTKIPPHHNHHHHHHTRADAHPQQRAKRPLTPFSFNIWVVSRDLPSCVPV